MRFIFSLLFIYSFLFAECDTTIYGPGYVVYDYHDEETGSREGSSYYHYTSDCSLRSFIQITNVHEDVDTHIWYRDSTQTDYHVCTDTPPDGWLDYPKISGSECTPYSDLTYYEKTLYSDQGALYCNSCYAPPYDDTTCQPPNVLDTSTGDILCVNPLDPNGDLDGDGIPNGQDDDADGDGVPNILDNLVGDGVNDPNNPYTSLPDGATCDSLLAQYQSLCDIRDNDFRWQCDMVNSLPILRVNSCTPRIGLSLCADEYKYYDVICNPYGYFGSCVDNKVMITQNTLECKDPPDPSLQCDTTWHESWNGTACECNAGYSYNSFGDCWKILDDNATAAEQNQDEINQKNFSDDEKQKAEDDIKAQEERDRYANDAATLAGLRADNNITNNLLGQINDKLNSDSNSTGKIIIDNIPEAPTLDAINDSNNALAAFNEVKIAFNTVSSDFNSLKSNIDSGFSVSATNNGTTPQVGFYFHGIYIDLDLCTSFSRFYSIVYFVTSLIFTILGLRFFYYGFTLKV